MALQPSPPHRTSRHSLVLTVWVLRRLSSCPCHRPPSSDHLLQTAYVVASTTSVDTEHVQCVILDLCLVGNDPGVMTIARRVVLHGGSEGHVGYPEWIHELHCVPAAPCAWCSACDAPSVAFSNSRVVDSLSASCMHLVDRVLPLAKLSAQFIFLLVSLASKWVDADEQKWAVRVPAALWRRERTGCRLAHAACAPSDSMACRKRRDHTSRSRLEVSFPIPLSA